MRTDDERRNGLWTFVHPLTINTGNWNCLFQTVTLRMRTMQQSFFSIAKLLLKSLVSFANAAKRYGEDYSQKTMLIRLCSPSAGLSGAAGYRSSVQPNSAMKGLGRRCATL